MRDLAELVGRVSELERRVYGMVRHGAVAEVDPAKGVVRMRLGKTSDGGDFLSPWVPYSQVAGALKVHAPPVVGQQFTLVAPSGDWQQAVAVPMTWNDGNASPSSAGDQNVITYGNVTMTLADDLVRTEVGGLTFEMTGDKAEVVVGGVTFKVSGAGVEITGGMVKHNGTDIGDTHTHTDTPGLQAGTTSPPN